MASKWTKSYTNIDLINNGYEYSVGDWFTIDMVNYAINNTQWLKNNKVDKESGKGLSTNDFTNNDKSKLDGIETNAQKNTVTSVNGLTGAVIIDAENSGGVTLNSDQTIKGLKTFKVKNLYTSTSGVSTVSFNQNGLFIVTISYNIGITVKDVQLLYSITFALTDNEIIYPCFTYTGSTPTGIKYLRLYRKATSISQGNLNVELYSTDGLNVSIVSGGAKIKSIDEVIGITTF